MLTDKLYGRLRLSLPVAGLHLLVSALVALSCAYLVFFVWFPGPFSSFAGGTFLLTIIVLVDVVSGPFITLLSYSPEKEKWKWHLDITLIGLFQLSALIYGLSVLHQARPVKVAFEGEQFRLVLAGDIAKGALVGAPRQLQTGFMIGPEPVGVSLLASDDEGFKDSVVMALAGYHPAFRPSRWEPYNDYKDRVITSATPLEQLSAELRLEFEYEVGNPDRVLGVVPFEVGLSRRWSILIDMETAEILGYEDVNIWDLGNE